MTAFVAQGKTFNRLTVIERAPNQGKHINWLCRCQCGNIVSVRSFRVKHGVTKSCGCLIADWNRTNKRTHGLYGTREYTIWTLLKQRCFNPNTFGYENYGGRGITMCDRWLDVRRFVQDMGKAPSLKHTIDRIDNDGSYSPENCRWATDKDQMRNKRNNHWVEFQGQRKCIAEWSEIVGVEQSTLGARLKRGWTPERTLTTKV